MPCKKRRLRVALRFCGERQYPDRFLHKSGQQGLPYF
jgi:hypothetical protein